MSSRPTQQSLPQVVFLIGYRASGKSLVGKQLAAELGYRFVDTDVELQPQLGMTIAESFERHGEAAFRRAETAVLKAVIDDAAGGPGAVVATGGGIVLAPANVDAMRASGRVVWLSAAPEVLRRRLGDDPSSASMRPSLSGQASAADEIEAVLAERLPLYRSAAHLELPTDDAPPDVLVEQLIARLGP